MVVSLVAADLTIGQPISGEPTINIVRPSTVIKRRFRARQKAGGAVPRIPLRDANGLVDLLVDLRWLFLSQSENPREVRAAAGRLLDELTAWANHMRDKYGPQWTDHVQFPCSNRLDEQ